MASSQNSQNRGQIARNTVPTQLCYADPSSSSSVLRELSNAGPSSSSSVLRAQLANRSSAPKRIQIVIQLPEDKEDVNKGQSKKHIAFARYARNHSQLMGRTFLNSFVPVVRSVVAADRMQALKREIQRSTTYQKKLEEDLQVVEEKFQEKKQRFIDSHKTFNVELETLCKKVKDHEELERIVHEQMKKWSIGRNRKLIPPTTPAPAQGKQPQSGSSVTSARPL